MTAPDLHTAARPHHTPNVQPSSRRSGWWTWACPGCDTTVTTTQEPVARLTAALHARDLP